MTDPNPQQLSHDDYDRSEAAAKEIASMFFAADDPRHFQLVQFISGAIDKAVIAERSKPGK